MYVTATFACPTVFYDGPECQKDEFGLTSLATCPSTLKYIEYANRDDTIAPFADRAYLFARTHGWVPATELSPALWEHRTTRVDPATGGHGGTPWLFCPDCARNDMHIGPPWFGVRSTPHPRDECADCREWSRATTFHRPEDCEKCARQARIRDEREARAARKAKRA